jgi:hypothetical protein
MRAIAFALLVGTGATTGLAADSYKVSTLKEPPPDAVAAAVRGDLAMEGFRIQDQKGQTLADIWLRKAIPGSDKPAGPKGAVQFPFLADGELLGVVRFQTEGHDYRDQPIAKGVYTMRFGLQPVNGDHLGVSTYRDYALLLPVSKDQSLVVPPRKQLEERSAESAGTSHPAVFLMLEPPPEAAKSVPAIIHDGEKNTWCVILSLNLQVKGQSIVHPVSFVVVGMAPA